MGWFWQQSNTSSSSPPPTTTSPSSPSAPPQDSHHDAPPAQAPQQPMSTEDKELASFLALLQEGTKPPTKPVTSASLPKSHPHYDPNRPSPASAAINDAILPTTMSCRDAFDYAWHCHTPAAQWNAVYRYGGVRECSDLWEDFWFCMRTKQYSPEMRAQAIRDHYRERQNAKYYAPGQPSSEDVWQSRERMVEPGTAFRHTFDDPAESDTEWNLKEIERRRRIREQTFGKES
ncbi:hypothetical protein CONLIGDRAFT_446645 [Coniochaeta ligniaria NRRL 30616]|uniref:Early meiotic induction protein 1 n=1 Tax=Coniochaeta ligniaria NRRL 30616 TaxID=1408157 RepID=A0A1J7JEN2_9PEZI|nr:hypothetical protein CONLIGDRAFT_446645 [Coniochaeta ligniaria NRRL 30616]